MSANSGLRTVVLAFAAGALAGAAGLWLAIGNAPREGDRAGQAGQAGSLSGKGFAPTAGGRKASGWAGPKVGGPAPAPTGDPAADLRRILRMGNLEARTAALRRMLAGQSPEQLAATMKELKKFLDNQEQEDTPVGVMAILSSWEITIDHSAATDPAAVLAALKADPEARNCDDFAKGIFRSWATRDIDAARQYLETRVLTDPEADQKGWMGEFAREYVKQDPDATFVWLRGLNSEVANKEMGDAFQTLSHFDSTRAGKLLATQGDLPDAPDWAASMCRGWAITEPDKALEWATCLPSRLAAEAIPVAAREFGEKAPAQALDAIRAMNGTEKALALAGLTKSLPAEQIASVMPMVDGLADGPQKAVAVEKVMAKWSAKAPDEASAWLARQPAGAARDAGAATLSDAIVDAEPDAAMTWAACIGSEAKRQQQLDALVNRWLAKEPASARHWVQESTALTETDRARLLERTGR